MPTIELRVDTCGTDELPHTFIIIEHPNGETKGYGFGPLHSGDGNIHLIDEGIVKNTELNYEYQQSSGKLEINNEQYEQLMDYVNRTTLNPPEYNIPAGIQCTTWVLRGLFEAGVIPALLAPSPWLSSILDSIFFNPYWQGVGFMINKTLRDLYNAAQLFDQRKDPLTLDLDGDGIETVAASTTNPILFDHDGDGVKTGTGWIKADDGMLVMDRNGNSTIDDGTELFGDATPLMGGGQAADGFAALSREDTNGDGVVNNLDARWSQLRVWCDLNQDGISQSGELLTSGRDCRIQCNQ